MAASRSKSWSKRDKVALAAFVVCVVLLLPSVLRERWLTDDALISFRYVDNFLAGAGLVFNIGERLEAFSSPLMLFILALFQQLGVSPTWTSQILGITATIVELALIFVVLRPYGRVPMAAILAGLLFVDDRIVWVWATGGLETSLYAMLLTASLTLAVLQRRDGKPEKLATTAGVVHLLLAAARPEGLLFFAIYLGACLLAARSGDRKAWKRAMSRTVSIVVIGVFVLLMARWFYYGALLPHSYYAKIAGVPVAEFGRGYLVGFARREGFYGLTLLIWLGVLVAYVVAVLFFRREVADRQVSDPASSLRMRREQGDERARLRVIAIIAGLYLVVGLVVVGFEGGDYMSDFRLIRPLLAPLFMIVAIPACYGFSTENRWAQLVGLVVAAALLLTHGLLQRDPSPLYPDAPPPEEHKRNNTASEEKASDFRAALERFTKHGDKILTDDSGYKGYGHQLHTVDATGLTSPQIEGNFYLRPEWATPTYRDRLPGHARWP
ncbi:MAG: hypothetical protein KC431_13430, partial [Myxococcales bacterium]|nr:hypothetical protein [Myxococcales bacterium]